MLVTEKLFLMGMKHDIAIKENIVIFFPPIRVCIDSCVRQNLQNKKIEIIEQIVKILFDT